MRTDTTKVPHVGGAALAIEGEEEEVESESVLEEVESVELGRGEGREGGGRDKDAEGGTAEDPEEATAEANADEPPDTAGHATESATGREVAGGEGGKSASSAWLKMGSLSVPSAGVRGGAAIDRTIDRAFS